MDTGEGSRLTTQLDAEKLAIVRKAEAALSALLHMADAGSLRAALDCRSTRMLVQEETERVGRDHVCVTQDESFEHWALCEETEKPRWREQVSMVSLVRLLSTPEGLSWRA